MTCHAKMNCKYTSVDLGVLDSIMCALLMGMDKARKDSKSVQLIFQFRTGRHLKYLLIITVVQSCRRLDHVQKVEPGVPYHLLRICCESFCIESCKLITSMYKVIKLSLKKI